MEQKSAATLRVEINLAGDLAVIKQRCREHCYAVGLCVTVTPTTFIYTGGEESGVKVGLVNYPRFPTAEAELMDKAITLATSLMEAACQHSALVVGERDTIWLSRRGDNPAAKLGSR